VKFLQILGLLLKSKDEFGPGKRIKTKWWGQKFYRDPPILSTALSRNHDFLAKLFTHGFKKIYKM
jgi:hypothetical protein